MFGMRHFNLGGDDRWVAGRGWRHRHGRHGFGGRHGMGDGDMMRAGRMLAQGDLRLIALALIAEQPRHGYEIIKLLEDKTEGWYSPSPGIVYPTLTYLEEAGYVTAQSEGAKKLYSITEEGRAHLAENRDVVDAVLDRLAAVGRRFERMRRRSGEDDDGRRDRGIPPLVKAALDNLREAVVQQLDGDPGTEAKVVEILAQAAADFRRK
jgi:DNA-binding PadR family transcriptional regulator